MTRNQFLTMMDLITPCKPLHKGQKLVDPKQTVHHQQWRENHVQMAALTASNNVSEGRRSDREASLLFIMRRFSRFAADEVNKARKEKGKKNVLRVEGCQNVQLFSAYCDSFNARVARADVGEKYRQLVRYLEGDTNRMSRADLEK